MPSTMSMRRVNSSQTSLRHPLASSKSLIDSSVGVSALPPCLLPLASRCSFTLSAIPSNALPLERPGNPILQSWPTNSSRTPSFPSLLEPSFSTWVTTGPKTCTSMQLVENTSASDHSVRQNVLSPGTSRSVRLLAEKDVEVAATCFKVPSQRALPAPIQV